MVVRPHGVGTMLNHKGVRAFVVTIALLVALVVHIIVTFFYW